ncbi:alpha-mannosidase [Enterococcus sp. BWB1-3]|uniref:alpha-mannosidase n=1 Tax=Enterococcus sp. BWB1-3 TaxID=2787713 RepID=UPI0019215058|nr:alpha-mannosidase [Enterococcus sp. BWB1-3]MBL1228079.1 alpha-mannosidase [Enterococcus sp. BWB1-3]
MKKKVYIVSHSHWDREWYLPYEQHHMRLIELMDDLLELFETDPEFKSFHLDGQTIILDDYLQVRPEKRAAVQRAIAEGKLQIGPFYILQDDFLISSESNTRNMLIGMEESKKWGTPVALGYFPDTFGNMGQTPQMMLQAGLKSAAFGRGVKPIGFDNEVLSDDHFTSQYSEMFWEGPDGSRIFGLLFANWYSNGNEIPVNEEEAKIFWEQKLAEVERFGSTRHYLMMNGVDHQPVQKDITKAIHTANRLFPDYEFIHAGFTEYLKEVQKELPEDLGTVTGELTSQETDGWFTLANTASSRVYLKQWNTQVSRQLENISEPLAAMAYELTGKYDHDTLDYAWKTLMQNHPHDSICGCSLDEVHREMMMRFQKANEVGKYLAEEAAASLVEAMDTSGFPENSRPFVIFNTSGQKRAGIAVVEIELERKTFKEGLPVQLYSMLKNQPSRDYYVINQFGDTVNASITTEEVLFDYELPKDAFRIPFMKRFVTVSVETSEMAEFSWETLALVEGKKENEKVKLVHANGRILENEQVKVEVAADGSIAITDKGTGKTVENLLVFEDVGDIANEYIFKQPEGDQAILSTNFTHNIKIMENSDICGKICLTQTLRIPKSADELLEEEQKAVVDFRYRKAQRSKEMVPFTIETLITIDRVNKHVGFETTIDNQAKDHRLRVLFPTGIKAETHEADSIYEAVVRPNKVSSHWENPANPQHQHAFVNLHDSYFGVTVSNIGLNEYEIIEDTIALTLLRCTGELGDWGWFPTPEAQCIGQHTFTYAIEFHGRPDQRYQTYRHAHSLQIPFSTKQLPRQIGSLPGCNQYLIVEGDTFAVTALKRSKEKNRLVLRGYNLSDKHADLTIKKDKEQLFLLNLLEEDQKQKYSNQLKPCEIRTIGFGEAD